MTTSPGRKVFVSYCHQQKDWVRDRLVPILNAAGVEILIDHERFLAAKSLHPQMDGLQDQAHHTLTVLSPDYLTSDNCLHELNRAIAKDHQFKNGHTIPVKRADCTLPQKIKNPNPLYVDLRDDSDPAPWSLLLRTLSADLGCDAPAWLTARDQLVRHLERHDSVNLLITGHPNWRPLIDHLQADHFPDLIQIDLNSGSTASRPALVREILRAAGLDIPVPPAPDDLVTLANSFPRNRHCRIALLHFDLFTARPDYGLDLALALRTLIEQRRLTLLIQSRAPLDSLAPTTSPWPPLIQTIELPGYTP